MAQKKESQKSFRVRLIWKTLVATLVAGLVPLLLLSYRSFQAIDDTGRKVEEGIAKVLDDKSVEALEVRARQTAQDITDLLEGSVEDTLYLASIPIVQSDFLRFYEAQTSELWHLDGDAENVGEIHEESLLYREIAFIDAEGMEQILILDGKVQPGSRLRDVSDPGNTTYKTEIYFNEAIKLSEGEVYVSPVTSYYITTDEQPADALDQDESRFDYVNYVAVIRFATPVYDRSGALEGVVVLSLDHRHIMEIANHVQSTSNIVAWPDYGSGNYSYLLDYEGWLIAHPNFRYLRGLDSEGSMMPTWMTETINENLPFNMLESDIKEQANIIANDIVSGNSGDERSLTREDTPKVDIYVPILFDHGVYKETGIFGGVVLSESVEWFDEAKVITNNSITSTTSEISSSLVGIVGFSLVVLITAALWLARNITQPIGRLTDAARLMEEGELDVDLLEGLLTRRIEDEVTDLARVFKQMAQAVKMRETKLREQVAALKIEIDDSKKAEEVAQITDSDSFRELQDKISKMRAKRSEEDKDKK